MVHMCKTRHIIYKTRHAMGEIEGKHHMEIKSL